MDFRTSAGNALEVLAATAAAAFCSAFVATALLSSLTIAQAAPAKAEKRGDISYLATPGGMTLYTYSKDRPHAKRSQCNGQCAQAWPPFVAGKGGQSGGDWKIVSRDDNVPQWEYKGHPLYTFFKDTHPGEMKGQNYEGHAWQVAKP